MSNDTRRAKSSGSIYFHKGKNKWLATIDVGVSSDGKAKKKYFYGDTKEEVEDKLFQARVEYQEIEPDDGEITVSEWCRLWIKRYKLRKLNGTIFRLETIPNFV